MSDIQTETPRRGRPPRAEAVASGRRRRKTGSLNRMAQFKLDFIEPEDLDLANYQYRWTNDEGSRIRQLTRADDYDFVTLDELGQGVDRDQTDSESDGRMRVLVGKDKSGNPTYSYLLKKRREFFEADQEEEVIAREEQMAGRVYRGEVDEPEEAALANHAYVPAGVQLGGAAQRRRGPIPRKLK
jgi:hypothetical protein